jgi:hypothetical protein
MAFPRPGAPKMRSAKETFEHAKDTRGASAAAGARNERARRGVVVRSWMHYGAGYRAKAANLGWPLPTELSDAELEALLFPPAPPADTDRPLPDWPRVRAELGKKGVTMTLVWQEYLQAHPSGYRYSRFVEMYRGVGRQTHLLDGSASPSRREALRRL